MNQKKCRMYSFLKAVRGCWHNAMFIKCDYNTCPHKGTLSCEGFLMGIDADGTPILVSVEHLRRLTGESIEPEGCQAVVGKRSFETIYGLYMEWHTVSSAGCPLLELCQVSDSSCCL